MAGEKAGQLGAQAVLAGTPGLRQLTTVRNPRLRGSDALF